MAWRRVQEGRVTCVLSIGAPSGNVKAVPTTTCRTFALLVSYPRPSPGTQGKRHRRAASARHDRLKVDSRRPTAPAGYHHCNDVAMYPSLCLPLPGRRQRPGQPTHRLLPLGRGRQRQQHQVPQLQRLLRATRHVPVEQPVCQPWREPVGARALCSEGMGCQLRPDLQVRYDYPVVLV